MSTDMFELTKIVVSNETDHKNLHKLLTKRSKAFLQPVPQVQSHQSNFPPSFATLIITRDFLLSFCS